MKKPNQREDINVKKVFSDGKTLDRAFILPIVGLLLLVPPVANIFQLDVYLAGIPFTALYLFSVWGLLIVGAIALSRKLRAHPQDRQETAQENLPVE